MKPQFTRTLPSHLMKCQLLRLLPYLWRYFKLHIKKKSTKLNKQPFNFLGWKPLRVRNGKSVRFLNYMGTYINVLCYFRNFDSVRFSYCPKFIRLYHWYVFFLLFKFKKTSSQSGSFVSWCMIKALSQFFLKILQF